jgi:VIT1/CCC1 family predicted Fe2+/Mn2+ transporter
VAFELASNKQVLLKTMVENELGLAIDEDGNTLRGAVVMGGSFGVASLVPIVPYLLVPIGMALYDSVGLTALTLFGMGVLKSRWTRRHWFPSGLEIFALGAFAGLAGYLFGTPWPWLASAHSISYARYTRTSITLRRTRIEPARPF